ncbi:MAG: GNAT family N-acetyltransferase [Oscillospiraceae bacterium]|nr:GNAT family N-acetyltransferase [Oscillospiraceae bacterium]
MDIEIRKLTPGLAEDYARFHDATPYRGPEGVIHCYCVSWRSGGWSGKDGHWFEPREERRAKAIEFVKAGYIQGYLAYRGDEIVGWCNANTDCRECADYLRSFWPIGEPRADIKIKSIFCFLIAPEMQRQGVATQLIERVCRDAADNGFDFVEACVEKNPRKGATDFMGNLALYEKCGFVKYAKAKDMIVMRKALK